MRTQCYLSIVSVFWIGLSVQASETPRPEEITFSEHIAPIVFNNCASCHRPNEAAPFSLMSYRNVQKRGELILTVIEDR
ncbi:MAG: hypothetical protein OSB19_00310 [Opitutaceae bacterium]|nr:hypothetical protein [Opitutaceae bacterium]